MDELDIVPGIEGLVVAGCKHDKPDLDKDVLMRHLGVPVSYGEKLGTPAGLSSSDMNRNTKLFSETYNGSKIAIDRGCTKWALLRIKEGSLDLGVFGRTVYHPP